MGYGVVRVDTAGWEERPGHEGQAPRASAEVTGPAGLVASRARYWRYPPRTRGRRHANREQEEVFVCLRGTLTMLVGEPPERVELAPGDLVAIQTGTALQPRNETDEEVVFLAWGAPPVTDQADMLDDVVDAPPAA